MRQPGRCSADLALVELAGPGAATILAGVRESAPVVWVPALDGWLVTSYAEGLAVMRNAARFTVDDPRFSTARVVGASMLSTEDDAHRRHRAPFAPSFRAADLTARFGDEVERLAAQLVDGVATRLDRDGEADLRAELAGPLSVAVVAFALGLTDVDAATVLGWYRAIVDAVTAITAGETLPVEGERAMRELAATIRAGLGRDDRSLLGRARATLAGDDVIANAAVMMFGGIETTEGMIANLFVHLLSRPAALRAVAIDRSLVAPAIEESLRLEPAAAVVDRYATVDLELGGASIAAGELVRVSLLGANRDPALFPRPDEFALDRANVRSQLAFARGPHVCIAMDLARLETQAALTAVLDRLPPLRLTVPAAATGLVFRKPGAVLVAAAVH